MILIIILTSKFPDPAKPEPEKKRIRQDNRNTGSMCRIFEDLKARFFDCFFFTALPWYGKNNYNPFHPVILSGPFKSHAKNLC